MITTHELLEIRWEYKTNKDYVKADTLKNYLEVNHNLIIEDSKDYYETIFLSNNINKKDYLEDRKKQKRHEKVFESWLTSMNAKIKSKELFELSKPRLLTKEEINQDRIKSYKFLI